ncbi:hypothetical protein ID866_7746 [Astraeus odoratus]|nr:hypothetical protein ID866_7746 [Astraeus odoratus]
MSDHRKRCVRCYGNVRSTRVARRCARKRSREKDYGWDWDLLLDRQRDEMAHVTPGLPCTTPLVPSPLSRAPPGSDHSI